MEAACPECQMVYNLNDSKIPQSGARLKCKQCEATIQVKKKDEIDVSAKDSKKDNIKGSQIYYLKGIYRGIAVLVFFKLLDFVFQFTIGANAARF
jgi:predicted Zn finger-like uncharacterized protein